jgi:hypothetical protein
MRTGGNCRTVDREISRFPRKERLHMPGSSTTPGRSDLAMVRPKRVAFRARNGVSTRGLAFAAQWLAYALPYRRFVAVLADANARLGADVDRYSFIVVDLHHLLLAGLPAHFESYMPSHAVGLSQVRSPAIVMHVAGLEGRGEGGRLVQRKLTNGVREGAGCWPPVRAAYPRHCSSNANGLPGQNSAGFPQISANFQKDNLGRRF